MSVSRLLAEVDSRELAEWMAFSTLEGLPESRADFRAGQICATLANLQRKEDSPSLKPSDFMPDLSAADDGHEDEEEEAQLLDDPEAHSRLIMAAIFGITDT